MMMLCRYVLGLACTWARRTLGLSWEEGAGHSSSSPGEMSKSNPGSLGKLDDEHDAAPQVQSTPEPQVPWYHAHHIIYVVPPKPPRLHHRTQTRRQAGDISATCVSDELRINEPAALKQDEGGGQDARAPRHSSHGRFHRSRLCR
ncbi:hypothetical protein B0J13DRAFT_248817 [Dactylonectria estremocensis]|uniref:Secreted protein n=1 Tax=Dactylonectria estremocensis TaxID=1079267 RepID=A0A9P9F445_9HYPO|nr:hypothetical protein B0J13DRAFT_248817 [Dactylonectria estremocensis]